MLAEKLILREEREEGIKEGLRAAAPLIIGYIPIAMAFGILGKTAGITFSETVMFSAFRELIISIAIVLFILKKVVRVIL